MQFSHITKVNREELIDQAVRSIKFGRLVIARADTSYAILGLPHSKRATEELRRIKNGRGSKMYSVFMPAKKDVIAMTPDEHKDLAKKLVPGEVTLVVDKRKPAVRFIKHKTINEISKKIAEPLTATSANPSDQPPARNETEIRKYFDKNRVLVLFEGNIPVKLPSTIIDLTQPKPKILRHGSVTLN